MLLYNLVKFRKAEQNFFAVAVQLSGARKHKPFKQINKQDILILTLKKIN